MNNKKTMAEIILIIILIIVLGIIIGLFAKVTNTKQRRMDGGFHMQENKTKETTANDVAAIANGTTNALTIKLADNTTNNLSDGGSSEYDGCIFSYGKLTIEGNGILNVNGKQEEGEGIATKSCDLIINSGTINVNSQDDGLNAGGSGGSIIINGGTVYIKANGDGIDSNGALTINGGKVYTIGSSQGGDAGIDTDEGYIINGGELIAIGSDMLEKPESSSKQKYTCFELSTKVDSGSTQKIVLKL